MNANTNTTTTNTNTSALAGFDLAHVAAIAGVSVDQLASLPGGDILAALALAAEASAPKASPKASAPEASAPKASPKASAPKASAPAPIAPKSYTIASVATNSVMVAAEDMVRQYQTTKDYKDAATALACAASAFHTATDAHLASKAVRLAHKVSTMRAPAEMLSVAREMEMAALTTMCTYGYMGGIVVNGAEQWATSRNDVISAEFERYTSATGKTERMRLIVTRDNGKKLYMSVNTTAALDWRKIDTAYSKRIAKLAAK